MFEKSNPEGYIKKMEGVLLKTLIQGEKTHMTRVRLEKGAVIPTHSHKNEQTGILLAGCIDIEIDGDHFVAEQYDCWCINASIAHSATAIENSDIIEVFTPIRRDYLID